MHCDYSRVRGGRRTRHLRRQPFHLLPRQYLGRQARRASLLWMRRRRLLLLRRRLRLLSVRLIRVGAPARLRPQRQEGERRRTAPAYAARAWKRLYVGFWGFAARSATVRERAYECPTDIRRRASERRGSTLPRCFCTERTCTNAPTISSRRSGPSSRPGSPAKSGRILLPSIGGRCSCVRWAICTRGACSFRRRPLLCLPARLHVYVDETHATRRSSTRR